MKAPIPNDQQIIAEVGLAAFAGRVPEHVRDKLELKFRRDAQSYVLFERRPRMLAPHVWSESDVAKFTFVQKSGVWKLYRLDRNLKWRIYQPLPESRDIATLMNEVDEDPWNWFWG